MLKKIKQIWVEIHQWEQPLGGGGGGHTGMSACVCEHDGTDADKLPVSLALSVTASQLCFLFPK